jgi:nucleoside-diphosphate-sugar epimerase
MDVLNEDCVLSLGNEGTARLEALRGGTIFVTGGSGFVGTWLGTLVAYLNDRHNFGIELILSARSKSRFQVVAPHLAARKDVTFLVKDVRQMYDIPPATRWVVHAAGNPDRREHSTNQIETMAVIGEGTHRILRAVEQCPDLRMVLNLSSALVYGSQPPEVAAFAESYIGKIDTTMASSNYAEAKRYGEVLCAAARSQSRIPVVIARPFTFVGPFQSIEAPWALNNFIHAAIYGQPLKILGDGSTRRTFLYGSDAAVLLLRILSGSQSGDVYNLGSPEVVSLIDLARMVINAVNQPLDIQFNTARGAVSAAPLIPDMTKVEETFHYRPAIPLVQAIKRTIAWNAAKSGI